MIKNIDNILWWHSVPLLNGKITPGKIPIYKLEEDYLFNEINFNGKNVIDIGCWDGYFSFMAEKRGAKRVVGLDDPKFRWGGTDGFEFLKDHFKSKVQFVKGNIYDPPKEKFDIVLCFGVLYHLSDPLLAIINCFKMSNELVAVEGVIFEDDNPVLKLLKLGEFKSYDISNVYNMSTGFLRSIGNENGFDIIKQKQLIPHSPHRYSILFERQDEQESYYPPTCFPLPPMERKITRNTI